MDFSRPGSAVAVRDEVVIGMALLPGDAGADHDGCDDRQGARAGLHRVQPQW